MPALNEASQRWPKAERESVDALLERLKRTIHGAEEIDCAECRVHALRQERRLDDAAWDALRTAAASLAGSAEWAEFIHAVCNAWHGPPTNGSIQSSRHFAGPAVSPRDFVLGRAINLQGARRKAQAHAKIRLGRADPRSGGTGVALDPPQELHRFGLCEPMIWTTWSPTNATACPFQERTCSEEVDAALGLTECQQGSRTYFRYRLPASVRLHIPLLPDAINYGAHGACWHPYFLPAPPGAPCGTTRVVRRYAGQVAGCPEAIHRGLAHIKDVAALGIEVVDMAAGPRPVS